MLRISDREGKIHEARIDLFYHADSIPVKDLPMDSQDLILNCEGSLIDTLISFLDLNLDTPFPQREFPIHRKPESFYKEIRRCYPKYFELLSDQLRTDDEKYLLRKTPRNLTKIFQLIKLSDYLQITPLFRFLGSFLIEMLITDDDERYVPITKEEYIKRLKVYDGMETFTL